jgi:PAS domain S-box-containing protein
MGPRGRAQPVELTDDVPLREVVEAVPGGVLLVDAAGRIALANTSAGRLFDWAPADLAGAAVELLFSPTFVAALTRLPLQQEEADHRPIETLQRMTGHRRDGRALVVDVTLSPIQVGDAAYTFAVVTDAADRERHASRLALLDAVVEASSDALFTQDAGGAIVTWNRGAERIFGYPPHEVIGQRVAILFPEHLHADIDALFETVATGVRVDRIDAEIRRRDGMPMPISVSLSPIVDGAGVVIGSVSIARDITEMRLTQAALAEVEARLREGEALAHVGRWLWDVGTGSVQWSEELHRIHGVDPLEFAGTLDAHLERIHPDDRDRIRAGMEAAVRSGRRFEDEYRVERSERELRLVYVRAEPMMGSVDQVVGLRGIGHDVTDHRSG